MPNTPMSGNDSLQEVSVDIGNVKRFDQISEDSAVANRRHDLIFKGNAREYFKIWIVNVALTLFTLGIFSAWAKVRKKRYFHGNTYLDGNSFEYLANPLNILKGRVIAVSFFLLYWFASTFFPMLLVPVIVVGLLLLPWVIYRSLRFNAVNSAYRGVRFDFDGRYKEAAISFLFWPVLMPFTLGLIWPYAQFKQNNLVVGKSRFGEGMFEFCARPGEFYNLYFVLFLVLIALSLLISAVMFVVTGLSAGLAIKDNMSPILLALVPFLIALPIVFLQFLVYVYVQIRIRNLVYNNILFSKSHFESTLRVRDMFFLYLTNAIAIICSFGLLIPWAAIRLARYRAEHTFINAPGELEEVRSSGGRDGSALGEEMGDMFDVGVGV